MNVSQNIIINDTVTEQLAYGGASIGAVSSQSPSFTFSNGTSSGGTVGNVIDLKNEFAAISGTAVTLAAGASITYTLSAMTDGLGRAVAFARLRRHVIRIIAKTSGDFLTVGGAGARQCIDIVNGTFKVTDEDRKTFADGPGAIVTAGTSDQVKILNSSTHPITFEYALTGCST
ncbi:MAG: hypothetical protein ACJ72N_07350 [Labedaea sp.]